VNYSRFGRAVLRIKSIKRDVVIAYVNAPGPLMSVLFCSDAQGEILAHVLLGPESGLEQAARTCGPPGSGSRTVGGGVIGIGGGAGRFGDQDPRPEDACRFLPQGPCCGENWP
jgi:hypothetical protein